MAFILVLHCPRARGILCGSNNFLRSSSEMQNTPVNDTQTVFWFPAWLPLHVLVWPTTDLWPLASPGDFFGCPVHSQSHGSICIKAHIHTEQCCFSPGPESWGHSLLVDTSGTYLFCAQLQSTREPFALLAMTVRVISLATSSVWQSTLLLFPLFP